MNKTVPANVLRRVAVLLVAVVLLFCAVAAPQAEAADFKASFIKKNDDLKVNTEDFFDSNVVYRLPEAIRDDEEISVIISLDVSTLMDAYEKTDKTMSLAEFVMNSEEAKEVRETISTKKAEILNTLDQKAISYKTGADYDTLFAGFELLIQAGDLEATTKTMGKGMKLTVGEVYKTAETQLVENKVSVYETGIFDSSNVSFDGSGMVVAVLDTGIDYAHSAFSTKNFTSQKLGLTYEQVAAVMGDTTASKLFAGLSADDVFISNKIPFSFDYADADPDAYSDHNNHGTHVSGVICGKDDTITGVAPNAQLVSMKVFSSVMDTARSTWILSALEDCVVLDVDVINMSLGTSAGFGDPSQEELENGVYEKIRQAGISLIVAASNSYSAAYGSDKNGNLGLTSNPDTGTVGSPGTYLPALSVASINGVKTPYILHNDTIIYFSETTNGASEENNFFENLLGDRESVTMDYVIVPGVGRSADYTGLDVTGKIVLVRRGDNTFEEKAIIAQNKGAAGIVIYNNVSGDIKMNVGEATLAACSISQDMGQMLVAAGNGQFTIAANQKSGPFISDFSSWGPTPDLQIKPEITAHGGNILSAVTGGDYDRMSGTSMACPNVAGVTLLLRQYVVENFPEIADDHNAVNTMINRLMMSTADIIINKNGLPYAVRKQGAGLANLKDCIDTKALIITYDEDGNAMDKTKLELKDDPKKTGVYEMCFTVKNFGSSALSYDIGAYVMTEGVSETLTNAGLTTVTEAGYILEGATLEISATGGTLADKNLTVNAGQEAKVTVKITLSDDDKKYLDDSFVNGMYVEGFITLDATAGTEVDMSVPYLAFYGDWTKAPVLDLDYFQTDADERDDSIPMEDKVLADGYATRPIGGVQSDFVSYLGSYYFVQDPDDMIISASRDYIALSNREGTIHSLSFIWAGMLRNAEKIVVTITDDTTGEVIYEVEDDAIRKSYGDGGPIRPANVEVEFDTQDFNLKNNSEYTVKMVAYMDYGNGGLETNENNTFEFPLTIDFQAPTIEDVEFRYEYDKTLKKNRLYADISVYDNHHAMALQLSYAYMNAEQMIELKSFEQYLTPVYSQKDSTTVVTYELTDYVYEIKNNASTANSFVIACYDYALNFSVFEIGMPDNFTDFYFEGLPTDGLTLSPNETFSMEPLVYPDTEWAELLEYTSQRPSVVRVVNNKLVAVAPGKAVIRVRDPKTNKDARFTVTVLGEGDEGYKRMDKPVADNFEVLGYNTIHAFFQLASEEREIGATGDVRYFEGKYGLSMYPSEKVLLNVKLDAYFPESTYYIVESSNEKIIKINDDYTVEAVGEGYASISIKVMMDGKATYYAQSISVEVKDPFINLGASLSHYFGNAGVVQIPAKLHLTSIGAFAFTNYDYGDKTPEELEFDDSSATKQVPKGENQGVTKVIIPEGVERIDAYAFALMSGLKEIVLPSTLTEIAYNAFYGCSSLEKITFSGENNLKLINKSAFEGCDLQKYEIGGKVSDVLDLSSAYVIGNYAFAGNANLKGVHLPETLQSVGAYAFWNCKKLEDVKVTAERVKYGAYAFTGCTALKSFDINAYVIPAGMFYQCSSLETVTIGKDVNAINEYAFRDTKVSSMNVAEGNVAFKVQSADYVISADGTTLVAIAPSMKGELNTTTIGNAAITTIGRGAGSHNKELTTVKLPSVTNVKDYGFASSAKLENLQLGTLAQVGEYAFSETGLTQIPAMDANIHVGKYAFMASKLTSVNIPDGMTIAEGVFSECTSLNSVTIGNDVTLGDYAFFQSRDNGLNIGKQSIDGENIFYYVFTSPIRSLTIGNNVVIGENAFANACKLESIQLGENAVIGDMAFYNNSSLKDIDLSKVASLGEYAFSGDVWNMCFDDGMSVAAYDKAGNYLYTYHASKLSKVDLSSANAIGGYAFAYCHDLTDVVLGDGITTVPAYIFAHTINLKNVNLGNVVTVENYAFMESTITAADLYNATDVGEYAFVNCKELASVKLNPNGTNVAEGAFAYCEKVSDVENLNASQSIGSYAFAYTAITKADLSAATFLGEAAFLKDDRTEFEVTLTKNLAEVEDNPFAGCVLVPFYEEQKVEFNGKEYINKNYTFDLSEKVKIIDGSLYYVVENGGMELITYAGLDHSNAVIADGTVRISAMAFANTDVKMAILPHTVSAIGHKAFYGCDQLNIVVFNSYDAPTLEEEFDKGYHDSFEHIPGTGEYGTYEGPDGQPITIVGNGQVPFFMYNMTSGEMYSCIFYGANFKDYVGYVKDKIMMIRPSNGQDYETYMFRQYFDLVVDGGAAMDDNAKAFLAAVSQLPDRVTLEHEALVVAARAAYNKVASIEQRGLVEAAYNKLMAAEQRINQLRPAPENPPAGGDDQTPETPDNTGLIVVIAILVIAGIVIAVLALRKRKTPAAEIAPASEEAPAAEETTEAEAETKTEDETTTE